MSRTAEPTVINDPVMDRLNRRDRNLIFTLVLCTIALYFRVRHFEFVGDDDPLYVASNIYVLHGLNLHSLRWALTAAPNGNWHPLSLWVQMLIASVFGTGPGAYHVVNMLLHALNAALLYLFLRRSTGRTWPAFITSLLWAVHPMRVESVAWISELKDVLSGAFWLLAMLAYLRYSHRRTIGGLGVVTAFFTLSLLAKPMGVTMPEAFLLLDYWPLGRSRQALPTEPVRRWWGMRIIEKLPMVLLSVVDILLQKNRFGFTSDTLSFSLRVQNAVVSYAAYLRDLIAPYRLAVFYPHPVMLAHSGPAIPPVEVIVSALLLVFISALVCLRIRVQPYLAIGWFWFLGTLVPVIGLTQVGEQARADRFTYIPSIGIFMAVVWMVSDLAARQLFYRRLAVGAGVLAAVIFAAFSYSNISSWKDTNTLFHHLQHVQPDNYLALSAISEELRYSDNKQSLALGKQAVESSPASPQAHLAYGLSLQSAGRFEQAAQQFQKAEELDPTQTTAWDWLGSAREDQANEFARTKDPREKEFRERAVSDYATAVRMSSANIEALGHLAYQLAVLGRFDEAIPIWEHAVKLAPEVAQVQGDLADALRLKGDLPGAVEHYRAALEDGSKNPSWETNLAWLVATDPQATPADVQPMIVYAKDACDQTGDKQVAPLDAYAACLARVGRIDAAVSTARQAVAQANAANDSRLAAAIHRRLERYSQGLTYVAGDDTSTQPSTKPSTQIGPTTSSSAE
jgi:tetratricopeptide (TPR) repeat protein